VTRLNNRADDFDLSSATVEIELLDGETFRVPGQQPYNMIISAVLIFMLDSIVETQKLTVRLPVNDIAFLKHYARHRGITVTEALHRYLYRLREMERTDIHPEVSRITGLAPAVVDAREDYAAGLADKHR